MTTITLANLTDIPAPALAQTVAAASATILNGNGFVFVNYAGAVSLTLPTPTATPAEVCIMDRGGNCSFTNTITVIGTINGVGQYIMNQPWQSLTLVWDGTGWGIK